MQIKSAKTLHSQAELHQDFTLLQLAHGDVFEIMDYERKGTSNEITKRHEYAKKAIDQEIREGRIKPGELVLMETPHPISLEQALKVRPEITIKNWKEFWKDYYNFYHTIAEYAKSKGLRVESLEPGFFSTAKGHLSVFEKARARGKENNPDFQKWNSHLWDILQNRRNVSFRKKIQNKKPRMVVTADGHALYIEAIMKPRKSYWHFNYPSEEKKARTEELLERAATYFKRRTERRQQAVEQITDAA